LKLTAVVALHIAPHLARANVAQSPTELDVQLPILEKKLVAAGFSLLALLVRDLDVVSVAGVAQGTQRQDHRETPALRYSARS
jgi:hypothetical protein